jgi:hypothetical protein
LILDKPFRVLFESLLIQCFRFFSDHVRMRQNFLLESCTSFSVSLGHWTNDKRTEFSLHRLLQGTYAHLPLTRNIGGNKDPH